MFSNAFLYPFLTTILFMVISIVSLTKLHRTKQQLSEMEEALEEISEGNGNRKLLANQNDLTAPLSYKMNLIVSNYENRIAAMKRMDEANKQLMTSLSHDVRTPLTTLIGYLDATYNELVTGYERDVYIKTARNKAHDLKEYIDTLFDWFRLNSGEFSLSIKNVEATELTRDVLKDWIPVFEEQGIEYNIDIPELPCFIRLDENGYTRVINNLVQNVISHSQATLIKIMIKQENGINKICVSDNGIGISRENLQHIFDRLYKCDKGRAAKGSGLGLSITQEIVEKMGGFISAESIPNQITTFIIQFPFID